MGKHNSEMKPTEKEDSLNYLVEAKSQPSL